MERRGCCSGSRCNSTTPKASATPVTIPKKEEDVKPVVLQQDVKKEAATAAEVKGVKIEAKETVATAVKKEDVPVKAAAGCFGGGGCA